MQNLVDVSHTVCAHEGGPKHSEDAGSRLLGGRMAVALETRYTPVLPYQTSSQ